jgi:hypothetical protein
LSRQRTIGEYNTMYPHVTPDENYNSVAVGDLVVGSEAVDSVAAVDSEAVDSVAAVGSVVEASYMITKAAKTKPLAISDTEYHDNMLAQGAFTTREHNVNGKQVSYKGVDMGDYGHATKKVRLTEDGVLRVYGDDAAKAAVEPVRDEGIRARPQQLHAHVVAHLHDHNLGQAVGALGGILRASFCSQRGEAAIHLVPRGVAVEVDPFI